MTFKTSPFVLDGPKTAVVVGEHDKIPHNADILPAESAFPLVRGASVVILGPEDRDHNPSLGEKALLHHAKSQRLSDEVAAKCDFIGSEDDVESDKSE